MDFISIFFLGALSFFIFFDLGEGSVMLDEEVSESTREVFSHSGRSESSEGGMMTGGL